MVSLEPVMGARKIPPEEGISGCRAVKRVGVNRTPVGGNSLWEVPKMREGMAIWLKQKEHRQGDT